MTDKCAITADYVTFQHIPSRKVMKIVCEIPEEAAPGFFSKFGVPRSGESKPVVIALLTDKATEQPEPEQQPEAPKEKRKFEEMSRAQQAGILCADDQFRSYLFIRYRNEWNRAHATIMDGSTADTAQCIEIAASVVRHIFAIDSRTKLDTGAEAARAWDGLVSDFRNWQKTDARYPEQIERMG